MLRFLSLLGLAVLAALAQTSTGQISVTVLDSFGAVVSGARVRLLGSHTGELVRTLETGEAGSQPGTGLIDLSTPRRLSELVAPLVASVSLVHTEVVIPQPWGADTLVHLAGRPGALE